MRVHNFGAGPCTLPVEVLEEIRDEFLDFGGSGMSLVEMSHRSPEYDAVHTRALELVRRVGDVPESHDVLFVQGGATLQFGMVPLNLLADGRRAGYVLSGSWAKKAYDDGAAVGEVYEAWSGAESGFTRMPDPGDLDLRPDTRYLHVTSNETIDGVRMVSWPDEAPLVADMSSDFFTRRVDWDRFDLVYGGVQKNLAPAGMAVVIGRRDVLEGAVRALPRYLDYGFHAGSRSLGNTPPMFPIHVMGKVLERIEDHGGLDALEARTAAKAAAVFSTIDASDGYYRNPVEPSVRSHVNVVFRLPDPEAEARFLEQAAARGLVGLKGHRSVGGIRASLYAALEQESVDVLVEFMEEFRASA